MWVTLSLHAVYLLDPDGTIFYRKIARRRAYPPEFLDAIDYHAKNSRLPDSGSMSGPSTGA